MRSLIVLLFALLLPSSAFAYGAIACDDLTGNIHCSSGRNFPSLDEALRRVEKNCHDTFGSDCKTEMSIVNSCVSVVVTFGHVYFSDEEDTPVRAIASAIRYCRNFSEPVCLVRQTECDGAAYHLSAGAPVDNTNNLPQPQAQSPQIAQAPSHPQDASPQQQEIDHRFDFLSDPGFYRALFIAKIIEDIRTGIGIGLGILIVVILFAKRAAIVNFIIHRNLPYKLPAYAEDIQVLFKRTQRVNWYGRVVFGIIVRLGMTEKQLELVRRYWLGRVVAFDSLRRQRQNELAKMHLQLAAETKLPPKEPTALRQLWAAIKYLLFVIFYVIRAFVSFFLGFLFLRVTIAKLIRGTRVESKDLALMLEAKEVIEHTATYLKEYLNTAETFDGRDELYNAE